MKCVYCGSEKVVKNGKSNQGKQRYLCREYGKIFVENPEIRHYSEELKNIALRLYADGVEIAVIARSLEVPCGHLPKNCIYHFTISPNSNFMLTICLIL